MTNLYTSSPSAGGVAMKSSSGSPPRRGLRSSVSGGDALRDMQQAYNRNDNRKQHLQTSNIAQEQRQFLLQGDGSSHHHKREPPRRRGVPARSKSSGEALLLLQQQVYAQDVQEKRKRAQQQQLGHQQPPQLASLSAHTTASASTLSTSMSAGLPPSSPPGGRRRLPSRAPSADGLSFSSAHASSHEQGSPTGGRRRPPSRSNSQNSAAAASFSESSRRPPSRNNSHNTAASSLSDTNSRHRASTVRPPPLALPAYQDTAAATSLASLSSHARLLREQEELLARMNGSSAPQLVRVSAPQQRQHTPPSRRRPPARSQSCDGLMPGAMPNLIPLGQMAAMSLEQSPRRKPPLAARIPSSPPQVTPNISSEDYANLLSSTGNKETARIEIAPGTTAPLLGTAENWRAVARDNYLPTSCVGCNVDMCCILTASYVLCPTCKTVSPLECGDPTAGSVGLGFTMGDLHNMQNEIVAQRERSGATRTERLG